MAHKNDLTTGPILPLLLKMAIPMMVGHMAHLVLSIVDGIYVSNLGTDESMAVLNYGFPLYYIPFALFNGVMAGSAAVLAQFVGAKDIHQAENTLSQVIILCLGAMALIAITFPVAVPVYLNTLKVSPHIASLTSSYIFITLFGLFFTIVAIVLASALRAEGNMRTLMHAMVAGTLLNIILDPFLIFDSFYFLGITFPGTGWGVKGAAAATLAAAFLSMIIIVYHFIMGKSLIKWVLWPSWSSWQGISRVFAVAAPAMLSQTMIGFYLMLMTALATPFGEYAIAAIGIGCRLDIIAVFPALAIMAAVVSLVGQNYGAGNMERVVRSVKTGIKTAFVFIFAIGIVVYFTRNILIGFFNPEPEVLKSASHYLGTVSLTYGFMGMAIVSAGAFQGLGRGMPSMIITILRLIFINLVFGFVLSRLLGLGENGVHYGPVIANVSAGVIAVGWILYSIKRLNQTAKS